MPLQPNQTFFSSWKLYMDVNRHDGAFQIFQHTISNLQRHKSAALRPRAIVAATFELDTDFWMQNNVAARLIAVSMGAAVLNLTEKEDVLSLYNTTCKETLKLNPKVCDLMGFPAVPYTYYVLQWRDTWTVWQRLTCTRFETALAKCRRRIMQIIILSTVAYTLYMVLKCIKRLLLILKACIIGI